MTLQQDITDMLIQRGYSQLRPWGINGYSRIYYGDGHVELTGENGFQFINLDKQKQFQKDVKECLTIWQQTHFRFVPEYDLPF
jgi:hypothetical protein